MPTKKKARKKAPARKQKPNETDKQDTCFVIMPFGDWFDTYYESIYLPAIEATGLTPRRADNLYRPSAIINDIWALTNEAKLILADLSEKNANVFYELGMAHALAKPAILVTDSMEDVPFDLRSLRVIVYEKNRPDWGDALREKIELAIQEVLASPLDAVLPTFIKVKESSTQPTASRVDKELISLRQDFDRLTRELSLSANATPSLITGAGLSRVAANPVLSRYSGGTVARITDFAVRELERGKDEREVIRELTMRYPLSQEALTAIVSNARALVRPESKSTEPTVEITEKQPDSTPTKV